MRTYSSKHETFVQLYTMLDQRRRRSFIIVDTLVTGEPSLCYLHDGDGICEEHERDHTSRDCGLYTPPGHTDQWAVTAEADLLYQLPECPVSVVTGPPPLKQVSGQLKQGG